MFLCTKNGYLNPPKGLKCGPNKTEGIGKQVVFSYSVSLADRICWFYNTSSNMSNKKDGGRSSGFLNHLVLHIYIYIKISSKHILMCASSSEKKTYVPVAHIPFCCLFLFRGPSFLKVMESLASKGFSRSNSMVFPVPKFGSKRPIAAQTQ